MAGVQVTIQDTTGTAARRAELPHDITMRRLIPALLTRLNLPILGPDGKPISYRLYHEGREVGQDETLRQAAVHDDANLSVVADVDGGETHPSVLGSLSLTKQILVQPNSVAIPIASADDLKQFPRLTGSRQIAVILWDLVSVCIRPAAQLPADVQMRKLLPALSQVSGVGIKLEDSSKDAFDYELRLKGGRTILDHETLEDAGVQHGDTLFFLLGPRRATAVSVAPSWNCTVCGRGFPEAWPYCPACGAADGRFRGFCPRCSRRLPPYPDILHCPTCGDRLPPSEPGSPA